MIRDNLKTAGLFAFAVALVVVATGFRISILWSCADPLGCSAMLGLALVLVVVGKTCDRNSGLARAVFAVGVMWAGCAWATLLAPRSLSGLSPLASALLLTPAYLLVGIRRGYGIAMRVFVAAAIAAALILPDLLPWFWRHNFRIPNLPTVKIAPGVYLRFGNLSIYFPFLAALMVKFILWWRKPRIPPGHCTTCGYNLGSPPI